MRTAKAAVYEAPNTPFVMKEFPLRPVHRGEVLVRVTMSTICRSDIHSYEGRRPNPCPGILGHEIIGIIDEIGEDIKQDMRGDPLKIGDRITWSEYFFQGDCYYREILDMPQKCHGVRKYGHDLAAVDAISFKTGLRVIPYIVPEYSLYLQLEKRYGIVRKLRYVRLSSKVDRPTPKLPPAPVPPTPPRLRPMPRSAR